MKSKLKKTYIILALVFVFFASANVVGFFFATRHDGTANISKDMFAGKVFEITPDAISVIDAREVKRTFIVTKDTKIVEGKNILQLLLFLIKQFFENLKKLTQKSILLKYLMNQKKRPIVG